MTGSTRTPSRTRHKSLESRMHENVHVRFGGRPSGKGPGSSSMNTGPRRAAHPTVRPETLAAANAPLVPRQADLPLAQAWGGGLVAALDGMRFVVPVPAAFARPNRKYFGSKRGMPSPNPIHDPAILPATHLRTGHR